MKQTFRTTSLIIALISLSGLTKLSVAAEIDASKSTPQTQAAKDPPNSAGETRKEIRENEDSSNKLDALKLDRDLLQSKVDDLQRQLESAQQDLASGKKTLADVNARVAALEKEKGQIAAALTEARDQARDSATKLAAEQVKAATLREDKQRLMSGTTTAKEEIARLQKRAGELETEAARADDLNKRLAERDQEIERLRKAAADRETLAGKVAGLTEKLERAKQRVAALTEELAARTEEVAHARQERDQLAQEARRQQGTKEETPIVSTAPSGRAEAALSVERDASADKSARERVKPEATLAQAEERRSSEEAKPSANGQEPKPATKEAKDAKEPGQRLAAAHATLAKSFEADIAKGDLTVHNAPYRLTITMADRALFEPGVGQIKPEGVKLLKKVSDVLKTLPDKQVRIESHPNEPPGTAQPKDKGPGNWELSMARTAHLVQHLLDEGAVDSSNLSVGVSSDVPGSGNNTEEGRQVARQTEIILSLKN